MKKRIFLSLFLIVVLCGAVIGGVFVAASFGEQINLATQEDGTEIQGDPVWGGKINCLLIGRDKGTFLTDTLILIQFDGDMKVMRSVSVPRDSRVKYRNSFMKINAVYGAKEREAGTMAMIKSITGLPIHYYVSFGIDGFKGIVDYLGGIDFNVPRDMKYKDPTQGLNIDLKAGMQHLDGDKAEQFVRFRKGYPEGDIGRVHAQQSFMKEFIKQKLTFANIARAGDIFNEVKKYVNTNLTLAETADLARKLKVFNTEEMTAIDLPGAPQTIDGLSYWVLNEAKIQEALVPFR